MRPVIYATLAALLALLGLVGVREAVGFRRAAEERERRQVQDRIGLVVDRWEDLIDRTMDGWFEELPLASESSIRTSELRLRSKLPWFDAVYVWEPADIVWPVAPVEENLAALKADPCMVAAARKAGEVEPIPAAMLYRSCIGRSPAVSLLAASEAAEIFNNADAPAAAERVISELGSLGPAGPGGGIPLGEASRAGLSARRLVFLHLQLARAEDMLGRTEVAEQILRALALEVASLDGGDLEALLPLWDYPIIHDLQGYSRPALVDDYDALYQRAVRRLATYTEVRERSWIPREAPTVDQGARLLVDQYGDPPYLFFYTRMDMGSMLAGIQLDQPALVRDFLKSVPASLRPFVSVRDPTGRVLGGNTDATEVEAAFTRILPHLRVGVSAGALSLEGGLRTAMVQLFPIALGIIIGMFSLFGLVHSDRKQAQLLERQRDFMTRVTHELKTPLAGIRLMAETLEMGAYRDEAQRESFAQRIVAEAERLGQRLDEVIRAASRPIDERPTAFDPADLLTGLVERWRPQFEQRGVTLHLEAKGGGRMLARQAYLRDALTNLIDNALKYRREDRNSEVWIKLGGDSRWVVFEVVDNGLGVPPNMRKAIFERFRRVEGPGRGKAGGHGLGLAFVAEAARLHGGRVECFEGVDGGARFVMKIRRRT